MRYGTSGGRWRGEWMPGEAGAEWNRYGAGGRAEGRGSRRYGAQYRDDGRYGYGGDYWWLGEHELRRRGPSGRYDERYRRFSERTHPRYSPVGGMYPPVGGSYAAGPPPRPLRESEWFSDWTRWF